MDPLRDIYRVNLSLATDLYQLTMAYGYWKAGVTDRETVFHLFFRRNPFSGGYSVACGLEAVLDYLSSFRFDPEDLDYLATLEGNDGKPLFEKGYLEHLAKMEFCCDVHAVPEGTLVFPHEPMLRIQGPIVQCQILETALLNLMNFQTLIATKAARICEATRGAPVLEFGLRRAQGMDGALSASRAAYIGGCAATSNVLAGRVFGIPVKGTHAHSWVMSFPSELESFEAYAKAMPNNCVFLVDTYNTMEGVKNAVRMGEWLREQGHKMVGIRLDSGDLAYLSAEARKVLDAAGFQDAAIVASNDLDETVIQSLMDQGAPIAVWGVGTKMVTAYDQPALGGVYKLSALRVKEGDWEHKIKLSEQSIKISNPGIQQVRRFRLKGEYLADMIYDTTQGVQDPPVIVDPSDLTRRNHPSAEAEWEDLLVPVIRAGKPCYQPPSLHSIRERTRTQLAGFHPGIRRFTNPHRYPVGLEFGLQELKNRLILEARGETV